MKKILPIVIAVICIVGIVLGCVCWYRSATKMPSDLQDEKSGEINSGEVVIKDSGEEILSSPIFTLEDYPKVDASLAIHPLVDSIASDFMGIPEDELDFEYTKGRTSDVYKNLVDGKVDVIFAAEPSDDDLAYAK